MWEDSQLENNVSSNYILSLPEMFKFGFAEAVADYEPPPGFHHIDAVAYKVPELLRAYSLGRVIDTLPYQEVKIHNEAHAARIKASCSYIVQAYIWELTQGSAEQVPRTCIPAALSIPLVEASQLLAEPPIYTYADSVLRNWKLVSGTIEASDIKLASPLTFSGEKFEVDFNCVHVRYELRGLQVIRLIPELYNCIINADCDEASHWLNKLAELIAALSSDMLCVLDVTTKSQFLQFIRPFLRGPTNVPSLMYEGYDLDFVGLHGESGAESSLLPLIDAILGTYSVDVLSKAEQAGFQGLHDALNEYKSFRKYMQKRAVQLINHLEGTQFMRAFVKEHPDSRLLARAYNNCIDAVKTFRQSHAKIISEYIGGPQSLSYLPAYSGTGGTTFSSYLSILAEALSYAEI